MNQNCEKVVTEMGEKIPKKSMPEFEIASEQVNELKAVSAVTKVLADNPQVIKEISEIFKQVEMEKERELVEKVTKLLAEKVTEVPAEQIKAAFNYWYLASGRVTPPMIVMARPLQWIHI